MTHILIIDDEPKMVATLERGFRQYGFDTSVITDGIDARVAKIDDYDLVVLDWMLPGFTGLDALYYWRTTKKYKTPVIMLTAKTATDYKVEGLNAGADDFMSKFFEWPELLARVNALLRRTQVPFEVGGIVLDTIEQQFLEKGKPIHLTPKEYAILKYCFARPGRIITRDQLMDILYGMDWPPESNVIERHLHALRNKFQHDPITTVRGVGYRLNTAK
jgi:DNA-binding response OmpR family regulator